MIFARATTCIFSACQRTYHTYYIQPLDIGCFAPLKRAYSHELETLTRNHINHITKLEFLPAFKEAFARSINTENIKASLKGAGIVPLDPEAVL